MRIVFDTYAWIEYFKGSKHGKVADKYLQNSEVITPVIVLLELSYKASKENWDFKRHLNFIKINSTILGISEKIIVEFGQIYNKTRKKIKEMGLVDILILTIASLENAKILTGDPHFKSFEQTVFLE